MNPAHFSHPPLCGCTACIMARGLEVPTHDKPCAAPGLTSYRYRGPYGWIMIGAKDHRDALREALRSTAAPVRMEEMQVWDLLEGRYVPVMP